MELKVTHIEGTIPQVSIECTYRHGEINTANNFIAIFGDTLTPNGSQDVAINFYADNFPLAEDTVCQVVLATLEDEDGNIYHIRTHAQPSISINGNEVTLTYTDCLLPLNGTNGTIIVKFINQL